MIIINANLNVKKIEKKRLFVSEKGNVYLDATIILFDAPDQYGNDGMIVQNVTKEERLEGKKGIPIGSVKYPTKKEISSEQTENIINDLPF